MTQEAIFVRPRSKSYALSAALRDALRVFLFSRVLVWASAVVAVYLVPFDRYQERQHDVPALTHPLGHALGSLARWDATWYLAIAQHGYRSASDAAFFPLYPVSIRAAAFEAGSAAVLLIAAYALSAAAIVVALWLLHRLACLELGRRFARPVLLLMALWPASFFLSAPYSESLFLALSVGMFYAARTQRWPLAAALCAGATATRPTGLLLLLPLAWMAWQARRVRWVALAPAGALAFSAWLALAGLRPFGWVDVERSWGHVFKGPFAGVRDAVMAGVQGAGSLDHVVSAENFAYLVLLALAVVALAGIFRRLPLAYGLYVAASLLVAVSAPVSWQPLMSFGRLLAVLFPIPMWMALVLARRRIAMGAVLAASSVALVGATALFATWHLVT